ncbi:MAG: alpha-L-rhamnosidase C-terminal domain-containing protein [Spirosomataceae bacterium]
MKPAYRILFCILFSCSILIQFNSWAQGTDLRFQNWPAQWITHPHAKNQEYGIFVFGKTFELVKDIEKFIIHVSADNRYKLYVNGKLASIGPARGDVNHWNYESVDISPFLKKGPNLLLAVVWNEGEWTQEAQISHRTGFILQGNSANEVMINTNSTWKVQEDKSYHPLPHQSSFYYVSGPGEFRRLQNQIQIQGTPDFQDTTWLPAKSIGSGVPKDLQGPYGTVSGWLLVPSSLPAMELRTESFRSATQIDETSFTELPMPSPQKPWVIPANSKRIVMLDQGYLTNAFPVLQFSAGQNATLVLQYAEGLYSAFPSKGNRNEWKGKKMIGRKDSLVSAGIVNQRFEPLSFRTYRYLQVTIQTSDIPLRLEGIESIFVGYPFDRVSKLTGGNQELHQILDIGWRTARLCAMDTYMDCPYYEQLQYIGDGRIQALVSLFNTQDDRLVKNALNQADQSRQPEGITLSRHPSRTPQYIPTFSLWYIGMLHDYGRYGADLGFVREKIPGMRQILAYFKKYQRLDGSLREVPHWMFTDWVDQTKDWKAGVGPVGQNGTSALYDLTLLYAYQKAVDLEIHFGNKIWASEYQVEANKLAKTIRAKYWDSTRNLWADREEKDVFSQHTNALAILTGLEKSQQVAQAILTDTSLAQASIYFKYYVHQALIQLGLGNEYLSWLDKWRENMQMGLTTWAEKSNVDQSRSDCHAWGSSPNIEFFRTLLGIDSDAPGFAKVKIQPHLGALTHVGGVMPHPLGLIDVQYRLEKNNWMVDIQLPKSLTGTLVWKNQILSLQEGTNHFQFPTKP